MKKLLIVLCVLALSAGLSAAAQPRPLGQNADPGRIVDRTVLCSTISIFGERSVRVSSTSPKSEPTFEFPAASRVVAGSAGLAESLAGLEAGPASGRTTGNVHHSKTRCRLSAKSVPLSSRGLPGPPTLFDQSLRCPAGRRVLVRLRATLDRRAVWRASGDFLIARGNFSTAALAVRTEAGKPIAYFTLDAGKTRFWTAGSCAR